MGERMAGSPAQHEEAPLRPLPARTIATWPIGTFVENIAVTGDGHFAICVHNKREIHYVAPDGARGPVVALPASPAGIVAGARDIYVVAGEPGQGPHRVLRIGPDGSVATHLVVPDTRFLNGFTPCGRGKAYCVDSLVGTVIEIDLLAPASRVVLNDDRLRKASSDPVLPGANGIKQGDDGLFITNTDRALVLRAPADAEGLTGDIEVVAERLRGDDLALDMRGDLYITNHVHNTLIRLGCDGSRVALAGPVEGMAGCTACAFGRGDDAASLFVTTTGGIVMPLDGIVQQAKLVRLDLGIAGRPIELID